MDILFAHDVISHVVSSSRTRGSNPIKQSQDFEVVRLDSRVCENDRVTLHKRKKLIFRGALKGILGMPGFMHLLGQA